MSLIRTIKLFLLVVLISCSVEEKENHTNFIEIGEVSIEGGNLSAEISAFEKQSKHLFTTNNAIGNRIDIINLTDPSHPMSLGNIVLRPLKEGKLTINSLAINNGLLAVATSAFDLQQNGSVFIYNTENHNKIKELKVGAMPDMVTFTPDGKYILTANEGEPNQSYDVDPEGSISIISTKNYEVTTLNFEPFANNKSNLTSKGFRIFGPNASFSQDIEPEYIAVSKDSKFAWATLQENNGIAKIDIDKKTITQIFPLGFKDYNIKGNEIDICDLDSGMHAANWPIKGMYQPDAIGVVKYDTSNYLITANEGDGRYYEGYSEYARLSDLPLDSIKFPNQATIKNCNELGRLFLTTTLGDTDNDGDYDELYTFGSRSFSIWNGDNGELVHDSKNELDKFLNDNSDLYDDDRSDDKGSEPEGLVIGHMNNHILLFLALERANAIITYDITNPQKPQFLQILKTGIGPEGVLFINKEESPNNKSLLVVSSEVDGKIKLYQPQ